MWSDTGCSADCACHCPCLCVWKEEKRHTTFQVSLTCSAFDWVCCLNEMCFLNLTIVSCKAISLFVRRSHDPYDRDLSHSKARRGKRKLRRSKSDKLGLTKSAGLVNCNTRYNCLPTYSNILFFLQLGVTRPTRPCTMMMRSWEHRPCRGLIQGILPHPIQSQMKK